MRPVLAKHCYSCHSATQMASLRVDSREALVRGGNSGPAIVPGKPEESLLIQTVSHAHARLRMPPPGKLSETEIQDLAAWIRDGAVWPAAPASASAGGKITAGQRAFWSFQPIQKPLVPEVRNRAWTRSPIDRFVLAKLEAKGIEPVGPADPRALIRRAYFDLVGLPPTPEQVDAFLADQSADSFAKVIESLLASPHYGERWARYWLDIARYADERLASTKDEPYPNSFRYRDWVVQAFNDDMPFDLFVKAQIAGDLLEGVERERVLPGLGFYGLSPELQDDRVDVTTRGFLALTVACAQCHDHKYDPIPQKDYYSLQGVFASTKPHEYPLAPPAAVEEYQAKKKQLDALEKELKDFLRRETAQVGEILAGQISRYLLAAFDVLRGAGLGETAQRDSLDAETLERWVSYLKLPKEHPHLADFDALVKRGGSRAEAREFAGRFQAFALSVIREKKEIDGQKAAAGKKPVAALETSKTILWKDLYHSTPRPDLPFQPALGILYYGEVNQYPGMEKQVMRFLEGDRRRHVDALLAEIERLSASLPPKYPFLHGIADADKPETLRVRIGGNADKLGDEAPRRFLSILSAGEPEPFGKGSGRLELAEAIASPRNPLTARVMANRVWMHHFGQGLVRTPSNFGQLGERPTHPELLDYLASRFIENRWSIKALHREIMLSAAYRLASADASKNANLDSENRLLWRAHRRRLDAEALRDSLLFVAGRLDPKAGGPAVWLTENYATRKGPDGEADK
ncbi:MAG: DUF1549 domain-containing protein, partial [Acidobacteria bacterium]|nr:DUF1549 domain-containing protein [Acidobacteriota bacterium]